MKKAMYGVAAVGALVVFGRAAKHLGHKLQEHCGEMAAHCREMKIGKA